MQQFRGNRQQIAPGKGFDFVSVAETRAHHDGLVAVFLVIAVNAAHRFHARIIIWRVAGYAFFRLVPIENPPDKRGNQIDARLRARHRLREAEQQRHVAANPLLSQRVCGLNPFPRGRDFNQNPVAAITRFFVQADQLARFFDGRLRIERQPGVGFRRDVTRHDFQEFAAEADEQFVNRVGQLLGGRAACPLAVGNRVSD